MVHVHSAYVSEGTFAIAFTLYNLVVRRQSESAILLSEKIFHIILWPLGTGIAIVPIFLHDYNQAGSWYVLAAFLIRY